MDYLQSAIVVFYQGRQAFYPVTIVAIQHTFNITHLCTMDMAAHYAVVAALARFACDSALEVCNVVQSAFDFML